MGAQPNNPFSNMKPGQSGQGTGGYGVTQTNGKYQSVPQIDPTAALNYFAQAGQVGAQYAMQGNQAYQQSLQTAAQQLQTGYSLADNQLNTLSQSSQQALTLFQQMLGITPPSQTAGYNNTLLQMDPSLTNIADLISQANNATDTNQRIALQQQIDRGLSAAGKQGIDAAQSAITALGGAPSVGGAVESGIKQYYQGLSAQGVPGASSQNPSDITNEENQILIKAGYNPNAITSVSEYNADLVKASGGGTVNPTVSGNQENAYNQQYLQPYNDKLSTLQGNLSQAQKQQFSINQFQNQFDSNFQQVKPEAFTGAQISAKLASTPGYQFQLDQGNQQVLRNQAAIGNLGTGNTQVALANYGQGLAQNTYNNYMGYLQNLITQGIPATTQLATNNQNLYGYLSNLTQLGGQATNSANQLAGQYLSNAANNQGTTSYNASALNTELQMQAFLMNNNAQNSANQAAMNVAGQLAQNQQNTANLQATGAGFYQATNAALGNSAGYFAGNNSAGNASSNNGAV